MDRQYRLINAKEYLDPNVIKNLKEAIEKVNEQIRPKENECISIDEYIILKDNYDPDAIVRYKIPRKVNYCIDTFPVELQSEMHRLKEELNLKKEQIISIKKEIDKIDIDLLSINGKIKCLENIVLDRVNKDKNIKVYNHFINKYSSFNECLTSNLDVLDKELKSDVRANLNNVELVIEDVINRYLNGNSSDSNNTRSQE